MARSVPLVNDVCMCTVIRVMAIHGNLRACPRTEHPLPVRRRHGILSGMRRYEPYVEPVRRSWTRDELRAAVACVRAMSTDEAAGRDPRRLERLGALATELGRDRQPVRMRLANIVHVLEGAGLLAPDCLPALPGVGRRIAAAILDAWHELDAAEDMAASGPVQARRPWTEEELSEALSTCRRMAVMEARLARALSPDECGDLIAETVARLGRRWSETRRVLTSVNNLAERTEGASPADAEETELSAEERAILKRLAGTAPSAE